jgi:uncharacterized membrane protein HdeD (DUF308 family)
MRTMQSASYCHFMPHEHDQPREQRRQPPTQLSARRLQDGSNIAAAALFVIGCVGFYSPRLNTAATTSFLLGSLLFLVGAISAASTTKTVDANAQ